MRRIICKIFGARVAMPALHIRSGQVKTRENHPYRFEIRNKWGYTLYRSCPTLRVRGTTSLYIDFQFLQKSPKRPCDNLTCDIVYSYGSRIFSQTTTHTLIRSKNYQLSMCQRLLVFNIPTNIPTRVLCLKLLNCDLLPS